MQRYEVESVHHISYPDIDATQNPHRVPKRSEGKERISGGPFGSGAIDIPLEERMQLAQDASFFNIITSQKSKPESSSAFAKSIDAGIKCFHERAIATKWKI